MKQRQCHPPNGRRYLTFIRLMRNNSYIYHTQCYANADAVYQWYALVPPFQNGTYRMTYSYSYLTARYSLGLSDILKVGTRLHADLSYHGRLSTVCVSRSFKLFLIGVLVL